jgi:ornithine--oxo-acid transaminase
MSESDRIIEVTERFGAHNYHPLPVVIAKAEHIWVEDVDGKRYMDMLSSYSAVNHGHRHPKIIQALVEQAGRVTLTSRAFHNDQLGAFFEELCEYCDAEMALPMNTGAEAVETAIKMVRKWGYQNLDVEPDCAEIIVCDGNFHGRTTTIISFSSEDEYKEGFGPLTPGFVRIPYGDAAALEAAINRNTVGFMVEPIQGEGGVVVPPDGYLREVRDICKTRGILFVLDEIQTGFCRTGRKFCYQHEDAKPDVLILGKALGGGVYPVSAVVTTRDIMMVFRPGDHGSTFGGNPLGAAVGREALRIFVEDKLDERAEELGKYFREQLRAMGSPLVDEVRGRGLLIGVELKKSAGGARPYCEALMDRGLLCKETHEDVIRFAPPLVITREEIDMAMDHVRAVLTA